MGEEGRKGQAVEGQIGLAEKKGEQDTREEGHSVKAVRKGGLTGKEGRSVQSVRKGGQERQERKGEQAIGRSEKGWIGHAKR